MSGQLHLRLESHGDESRGFPLHVTVFDFALRTVKDRWGEASGAMKLDLEPGTYGVRVSLASGRYIDRFVDVPADGDTELRVPLYELSPHESHEWAYFSQQMDAPTESSLVDRDYEGVWLRLWEFSAGAWRPIPIPSDAVERPDVSSDGVTYRFKSLGKRPYVLQTGGSRIPWRCTALPPVDRVMALIKPANPEAEYPLDVVVSTENWELQNLLNLLRSGQTNAAWDWARDVDEIAEEFLYFKLQDPAAAAVGGYFLLKIRELDLLHNWTHNLADWIDWMPDGAIIHAWHLFAQAESKPDQRADLTAQARDRLLQAIERGIPLYTEGLRLLRDGLLGLYRTAEDDDDAVEAALAQAGEYLSLADLAMPTSTFYAEVPDRPAEAARMGIPEDGQPLMYVFDVPLADLVDRGLLAPEVELEAGATEEIHLQRTEDGRLRGDDGTSYRTVSDLADRVPEIDDLSPYVTRVLPQRDSLFMAGEPLRSQTFSRSSAAPDLGVSGFLQMNDDGHFEQES